MNAVVNIYQINHQIQYKIDERSSKKIDCPFRINVGYRPVTKEIVIRNNNNNK